MKICGGERVREVRGCRAGGIEALLRLGMFWFIDPVGCRLVRPWEVRYGLRRARRDDVKLTLCEFAQGESFAAGEADWRREECTRCRKFARPVPRSLWRFC